MVNDARRWQDLAISVCEVEQGLQPVDVGALHEVGWVERNLEPLGHCKLLVAIHPIVWLFIDGHVHVEGRRAEVEHHGLLGEAETRECSSDHILNVVVQGLLDVDRR